jgi:4-hydroxymandelate oxidase
LLHRALEAGAEAVVMTLDTPVVATKFAVGEHVWDFVDPGLVRVNFDEGFDAEPGAAKATDIGPEDIVWVAERTGLPVVAKGVLRPDDAKRCVEAGARAVWVSNHGGRQLDRAAPTSACLPGVLDSVGGSAQVYVDGGIRSGLEILAALALGADAVFLGRLPMWALVEGESGVTRMHADLLEEVVEAFRLAGCARVADAPGLLASP